MPFPLVCLVGPTAVGKTALSIRLAREIGAEIVSADSVQIYRHLDIGAAKPTPAERGAVPHHLVDVADPDEPFDAADFARMAGSAIRSAIGRGKTVIVTGGTGLYLRALLDGLTPSPGEFPALRTQLSEISKRFGPGAIHSFLSQADPETARGLHPNDTFRGIRAIEILASTGRKPSEWRKTPVRPAYSGPRITIGLVRPREELNRRIDARVKDMLAQGFLEEVRGLLAMGYSPMLKPLQTIGYRHMILFLQGKWGLDEAVSALKRDTRRYAKRQLTWFRPDPAILWFHPEELLSHERIWEWISGPRHRN